MTAFRRSAGLEPATFSFAEKCSNQMSYEVTLTPRFPKFFLNEQLKTKLRRVKSALPTELYRPKTIVGLEPTTSRLEIRSNPYLSVLHFLYNYTNTHLCKGAV